MKTIIVLSALIFASGITNAQTEKAQDFSNVTVNSKIDSINQAFHDSMQARLIEIEPEANGNKIFHAGKRRKLE